MLKRLFFILLFPLQATLVSAQLPEFQIWNNPGAVTAPRAFSGDFACDSRMLKRLFFIVLFPLQATLVSAQLPEFQIWNNPGALELYKTMNTLSNPLIGDDGRIYTCSGKSFFAFESNGTVAWAVPINYTCHVDLAPVHDETGKIYLIAEDRVLKIIPSNLGTSESVIEIFFGPESLVGGSGEIIGLSIGIWSSSLFINLKNIGLFAYFLEGQLLWSIAPVLYRSGYRQGCKGNLSTCYFASAPIVDQCEGSVYVRFICADISFSDAYSYPVFRASNVFESWGNDRTAPFFKYLGHPHFKYWDQAPGSALNFVAMAVMVYRKVGSVRRLKTAITRLFSGILDNEGLLYSLSALRPYFNWIQDFSALGEPFTITPGNNGRIYLAFPRRALVMALDASTGNVLWEGNVGPLSTEQCRPLVDSMGWVSIGSLDGFLYSFSPAGIVKKHLTATANHSVIQVNPVLDCSGHAVYVAQLRMRSKTSNTSGNYTFISAMDPQNLIFKLLVPATGDVYWTAEYPGQLSSLWSESYLRHFALDARILLAFITSAKMGSNSLACRTTWEKLIWSCSQARPKYATIYTGNERKLLLFLLFQLLVLTVLAGFVRFCYMFWKKKKLQKHDLGKFLDKRRSLHMRKKTCDHMIRELSQRATKESMVDEVLEELEETVREREGIMRKLSTTYSLGRDDAGLEAGTVLPLYSRDKEKGKGKSYSFQRSNSESVTIFHTLSETSSIEGSGSSSSSSREACWDCFGDKESAAKLKPSMGVRLRGEGDLAGPSNSEWYEDRYWEGASSVSESKEFMNPLFDEYGEEYQIESVHRGMNSGLCLKRRRTLSSTN